MCEIEVDHLSHILNGIVWLIRNTVGTNLSPSMKCFFSAAKVWVFFISCWSLAAYKIWISRFDAKNDVINMFDATSMKLFNQLLNLIIDSNRYSMDIFCFLFFLINKTSLLTDGNWCFQQNKRILVLAYVLVVLLATYSTKLATIFSDLWSERSFFLIWSSVNLFFSIIYCTSQKLWNIHKAFRI